MNDAFSAVVLLLACGAVYFLPAIVAGARRHSSPGAVFVLNLFLGWTFLGWVLAFVWAMVNSPRRVE